MTLGPTAASSAAPRLWPWLLLLLLAALLLAGGWSYLEQRRGYLGLLERRISEVERRLADTDGSGAARTAAPARLVEDAAFKAASETLAAAELQSRLTTMIAAAGAELQSVRFLDAEDRPPFRMIRLRARFLADHGALREMLLAFDRHRPPLFPDLFSVQARESGTRLVVEMEVSALARIAEGEAD